MLLCTSSVIARATDGPSYSGIVLASRISLYILASLRLTWSKRFWIRLIAVVPFWAVSTMTPICLIKELAT